MAHCSQLSTTHREMENRSLNTAYEGLSEERPAVPVLKLPGKTSRDGALSLHARSRPRRRWPLETIATEREEEAAVLTAPGQRAEAAAQQAASAARAAAKVAQADPSQRAEAEEAAVEATMARQEAAAAAAAAAQATRKAAIDRAAAAASEGTFVLVSMQGFGRAASSPTATPSRRGTHGSLGCGGAGSCIMSSAAPAQRSTRAASGSHYMVRRHVSKATADAVNKTLEARQPSMVRTTGVQLKACMSDRCAEGGTFNVHQPPPYHARVI